MSIRLGRQATQQLTHAGLVLTPRRGRRGRQFAGALIVAAVLLLGATGGFLYGWQNPQGAQQLSTALRDRQQLQQRLDQAGLALRLSEARGQELERQVDALNQHLRECQEELAFFRKARDGKR